MHEATRTFCCRAVFLLACVLPTLLTGGWIAARRSPAHARQTQFAWQAELSRTLGLSACIERVEEPRPGRYILHGVTLSDPDAPRGSPPLASAAQVEVAQQKQGVVLLATDASLAREHLPRLWTILHERLLRGPETALAPARLSIARLKLTRAQNADVLLTDVRGELGARDNQARGALEFRLAGASGEPARMSVERDRAQRPVATKWALHSGAAALPCGPFADAMGALHRLGPHATFHGYVSVETRDDAWHAAAAGKLADVDLATLVTEHALTGRAEIDIAQANWRGGRLAAAAGHVRAQDGTLGRTAWEAAASEFGARLSPRLLESERELEPYGELSFGFEMNPRALRIAGTCAGQPSDTILTDGERPLMAGATAGPVEPIALVRFLVPDSDRQLPASAEARRLIHWMPLPERR